MSGPGAGGPQTASAVLGDVISAMIPPASTPETTRGAARSSSDVESAFYLHLEVADRPGVLAQVAELLGMQGVSVKSVVQKGLGDNARLVMVMHPLLESRFFAAAAADRPAGLHALAAARDPRDRRGVHAEPRRPDRALPRPAAVRARTTPSSRCGEGSTPLVLAARRLRARRRRGVAEARGRQPDRLVQGPRDDLRGVGRGARGRRGGHLRLDRQHRGERRRLRRARRADAAR